MKRVPTLLGLGLVLGLLGPLGLLLVSGHGIPEPDGGPASRPVIGGTGDAEPPGVATPEEERTEEGEPRTATCGLAFRVVAACDRSPVPAARLRLFEEYDCVTRVAEVVCDGVGRAEVGGLIPDREYFARVDAPGFRFEIAECSADPDDPDPWRIDLFPPVQLNAEVLDAVTGAGIAGARITSYTGPETIRSDTRILLGPPRDHTVSGPGGRFVLPDAGAVVRFEAEGYATVHVMRWTMDPPPDLRFRLVPSGRLHGRVTDPAGMPVPGARVVARPASWPYAVKDPSAVHLRSSSNLYGAPIHGLIGFESATTDAGGRYRLAISSGEAVQVRADGVGYRSSEHVLASVRPGSTRVLDLELRAPVAATEPPSPAPAERTASATEPPETVTISGRVIDENGVPVEGARVRHRAPHPVSTVTRPDGCFTMRATRRRWHALRAEADGFFPSVVSTDGETTEIRIERKVFIRLPLSVDPGVSPPERLDLDGRFEQASWDQARWPEGGSLDLVARAATRRIRLEASGFLPVVIPVEVRPGDSVTLREVRLDRGAELDVRVADDEGRPVPEAKVEAVQPDGNEQRGETDGEGRVRIAGLRPGQTAVLTVEKKHFVPFADRVEPPRTVDVRLVPCATLHGTVVDERGIPVSAAWVTAVHLPADGTGRRQTDRHTFADNAGRFRLRLPPGLYRVEIRIPGVDGRHGEPRPIQARREDDPPRRFTVRRN